MVPGTCCGRLVRSRLALGNARLQHKQHQQLLRCAMFAECADNQWTPHISEAVVLAAGHKSPAVRLRQDATVDKVGFEINQLLCHSLDRCCVSLVMILIWPMRSAWSQADIATGEVCI